MFAEAAPVTTTAPIGAWRYVEVPASPDEPPLADELEILQRIRCKGGELRHLPEGIQPTLYELWERVQAGILAEYVERLDPAQAGVQIKASQEWAIELLAAAGGDLAQRDVPASVVREAASALSVPRAPLVLRRLSALRRDLKVGEVTRAAAALGVLDVVATEGLRPAEETDQQPPVLTPDRVRLICYQVVHR